MVDHLQSKDRFQVKAIHCWYCLEMTEEYFKNLEASLRNILFESHCHKLKSMSFKATVQGAEESVSEIKSNTIGYISTFNNLLTWAANSSDLNLVLSTKETVHFTKMFYCFSSYTAEPIVQVDGKPNCCFFKFSPKLMFTKVLKAQLWVYLRPLQQTSTVYLQILRLKPVTDQGSRHISILPSRLNSTHGQATGRVSTLNMSSRTGSSSHTQIGALT